MPACMAGARAPVRILSILVVILFVAAALPTGEAVPDHVKKSRFRNEFLATFAGASPESMGLVYDGEGVQEMGLDEAADEYADYMASIWGSGPENGRGKMDQRGPGKGKGGSKSMSASGPAIAWAGAFTLREIAYSDSGNPTVACSHLARNAHYTVGMANPFFEEGVGQEYVGLAYSDVAAYGNGELVDQTTGEIFHYNMPVYYGGSSNFHCVEWPVGGTTLILNTPYVNGIVIGADA